MCCVSGERWVYSPCSCLPSFLHCHHLPLLHSLPLHLCCIHTTCLLLCMEQLQEAMEQLQQQGEQEVTLPTLPILPLAIQLILLLPPVIPHMPCSPRLAILSSSSLPLQQACPTISKEQQQQEEGEQQQRSGLCSTLPSSPHMLPLLPSSSSSISTLPLPLTLLSLLMQLASLLLHLHNSPRMEDRPLLYSSSSNTVDGRRCCRPLRAALPLLLLPPPLHQPLHLRLPLFSFLAPRDPGLA